jgi:MFS family permease
MAYHIEKLGTISPSFVPVLYSIAMASSGLGSLLFGRPFDKFGIGILIPLTLSAFYAPLVFMTKGASAIVLGIVVWGLYTGINESIIPAAVALMVPMQKRASAYGLFTAGYGIFWFIGSVIIGWFYNISIPLLVVFCLVTEFAAIPPLLRLKAEMAH